MKHDSKIAHVIPPPADKPERETKEKTSVYLSDTLRARLGRYMLDKHAGRLNVRNQIILDAIDRYLTEEGF